MARVQHGSALSSLVFGIYTSDIPTTTYVDLAMFADNVCMLARSRNARIIDRRFHAALDTGTQSGESPSIEGKVQLCFSREGISEQETFPFRRRHNLLQLTVD
ncbi:hypothetical protein Trydic_g1792 [Trypoxylus dichotomus]